MTPLLPARLALASALLACSGACASYNERTESALRAFEGGRFEEATVAYAEDSSGAGFLPAAEAGMAALTAGDWPRALELFTAAAAELEEVERKALVSPESAGELLLSWTLSETLSEYVGEGYERVMLHACLGLAYLTQGKVEDVHVEVRLANRLLENEEALYETEYAAGGLGHFLSALTYELSGDLDDAYIDYKRMEAKGVGGALTGRALVRLADWLGRDDDLPRWTERYGPPSSYPEGAASVVVLAGVGLGPFKEENRLEIPADDGLIAWSVPSFHRRPQPVSHLVLSAPSGKVRTEVVEDVGRVARRNLQDRLAWLAAKSAVRAYLKYELTESLADEHGDAGLVLGVLFTALTERADLRAWRTLPDTWQGARLFLEPGAHELTLAASGGEQVSLGAFELEPGETMFILARTLGGRVYPHPIGGRPVSAGKSPDQEIPQGEPR